jgi:hypothetical protein
MKLMYSTTMISKRTILQPQTSSLILLLNQLIFTTLQRVFIFHMITLNQLPLKFNWLLTMVIKELSLGKCLVILMISN